MSWTPREFPVLWCCPVTLTHREAIRFSNSSPKFNFIKVQGDTPAQNDTINKNLLTFEKVARRKIRLALIARDERHAKGDVKVDYSSGSDNDEEYGLNADVLDDGGMIVGDDHEEDQEEGRRRKRKMCP
ncbi:uncharacterized protein RCO7_07979 [Rhynchosporium graminicola]|uniref:Uncharacterized protein n=1 Tax=Rhynchosporium graminicola TaxID=2792576 RepID=A0A1E1KNV9_9HELO|nr:uncharacterized protein RCO7_07979 [Rhynchosporium commune]